MSFSSNSLAAFAFGCSLLMATPLALASDAGSLATAGFYVGGGLGVAKTRESEMGTVGGVPAVATVNDSAFSWKALAGFRLNDYFAVQLFYHDLGGLDLERVVNSVRQPDSTLDFSTWGAEVLGSYPVSDAISLFVKTGLHRWEGGINAAGTSDQGTDWLAGLGGDYTLDRDWKVRAELTHYRFDQHHLEDFDLALIYSF